MNYEVFSVLNGSILAGPRPSAKVLKKFVGIVDVVITLQWESEDPYQIQTICIGLGFEWIWTPIKAINWEVYNNDEVRQKVFESLQSVKALLEQGKSVLIHCAAGIHRTGFFVYSLLRLSGMSEQSTLDAILMFRPQVLDHIGKHRLIICENFVQVTQGVRVFTPYYETLDMKQSDFATGKRPVLCWVKIFFDGNLAKIQFCATPSDFSKIIVGGEVFMNVVERFGWSDLRGFVKGDEPVSSIWECEEILFGFIDSCQYGNPILLAGDNCECEIEFFRVYCAKVLEVVSGRVVEMSRIVGFEGRSGGSVYDYVRQALKMQSEVQALVETQLYGRKREENKTENQEIKIKNEEGMKKEGKKKKKPREKKKRNEEEVKEECKGEEIEQNTQKKRYLRKIKNENIEKGGEKKSGELEKGEGIDDRDEIITASMNTEKGCEKIFEKSIENSKICDEPLGK